MTHLLKKATSLVSKTTDAVTSIVTGEDNEKMTDEVREQLAAISLVNIKGTVKKAKDFSAAKDAMTMREAMKGLGTDASKLIEITAGRSNKQRQEIKVTYKQNTGKDLVKDIKSETSGKFCQLLVALYKPTAGFDASCIHAAIKGIGTDEDVLTDIMVSRTNKELEKIKKQFKEKYNDELENYICGDTSGFYQRFLVALNTARRDESTLVSLERAKQDAQVLWQAGEKKLGTDESSFITIFCSRSNVQLIATFEEYQKLTGKDILKSLDSEFSGDICAALKAIVGVVRCRPAYFAKQLYRSMKGLGTNDSELIRLIVSRSEVDLVQIKQAFTAMYKTTLEDWIKDDCSGDYKKLLLEIVKEH